MRLLYRESGLRDWLHRADNMNEKVLLIARILLLCAGCAVVAAFVIYLLREWLEWS